jgi:hypothetical protein
MTRTLRQQEMLGGDDARLALDVLNKITTPSRAIAIRDEQILDAVKRFRELQGAADGLARQSARAMPSTTPAPRACFWRRSKRNCLNA